MNSIGPEIRMRKERPPLWELLDTLKNHRWIDLTHPFEPGIPHCEAFDDERRSVLFHHEPGQGSKGHGFLAHEYRFAGQWGTHVDPGIHFSKQGRTLDAIPVEEMILPLVVIDIRDRVTVDPDACASLDDILGWERRNGLIPSMAFVALCTGWSRHWPNPEAMVNRDASGIAHFPGWDFEALRFLFETRGISACGHETTDTDSGLAVSRGDVSLETYVLGLDRWQIELMAHLDQVPETGALLVATWPKPRGGSGFPARVFAICPAVA